jgi:hypothetical protein
MWHQFMAAAGNAPGAQQGDVVVTLVQPVGGVGEVTVPSNDVTIAAEAGNLIGVQLLLPDGRHLFVAAGNLAGMIDAPVESARRGRAGQGKGDAGEDLDPGQGEDAGKGEGQDKAAAQRRAGK